VWIEELERWASPEECLAALRVASVGRISLTVGALPIIVPVPFAIDGNAIAMQLRAGSDVLGRVRGAVIAFEAGTFDPPSGEGWTVHAQGVADVIESMPPRPAHTVMLDPTGLSGYRYRLMP
jgi:hypothetical protein